MIEGASTFNVILGGFAALVGIFYLIVQIYNLLNPDTDPEAERERWTRIAYAMREYGVLLKATFVMYMLFPLLATGCYQMGISHQSITWTAWGNGFMGAMLLISFPAFTVAGLSIILSIVGGKAAYNALIAGLGSAVLGVFGQDVKFEKLEGWELRSINRRIASVVAWLLFYPIFVFVSGAPRSPMWIPLLLVLFGFLAWTSYGWLTHVPRFMKWIARTIVIGLVVYGVVQLYLLDPDPVAPGIQKRLKDGTMGDALNSFGSGLMDWTSHGLNEAGRWMSDEAGEGTQSHETSDLGSADPYPMVRPDGSKLWLGDRLRELERKNRSGRISLKEKETLHRLRRINGFESYK